MDTMKIAQAKTLTLRKVRMALKRVRAKLLSGEITADQFDMHASMVYRCETDHSCGTAGCIGGWMAIELGAQGVEVESLMTAAGNLDRRAVVLFHDYVLYSSATNITRRGAAGAITRYLEGKRIWR